MSLDQAFAHCPRFLTVAKCSSLVSVSMWLIIFSNQLRINGLVSYYPTNYLILYKLILEQLYTYYCLWSKIKTIYYQIVYFLTKNKSNFWLSKANSYILLTCALCNKYLLTFLHKLTCIKCIESVHSEPGSNSKKKQLLKQIESKLKKLKK